MQIAFASPRRFFGMSPFMAAIIVIGTATVVRFFLARWLPILPDEAYYYQWSRHLDASYYSKGPAVAYTIAAGTALFGSSNLGVRFFAVALSAGTAWQVFLLARRCYDEVTGLITILVLSVVPIYAVGAVVMTIDPLSAFFWVWAANCFSVAVEQGRWRDWLLTGFAVGCGFLAKYLNALELLSFFFFLLLVPKRRSWLRRPHFWSMLLMALLCTLPVWWWNQAHGWSSVTQLGNRGHLHGPFVVKPSLFFYFLTAQAVVLSPLLFLALLGIAGRTLIRWEKVGEREHLLVLLFLPVFLFYAILAWHFRGEPNWPAVSYLSLFVLLSAAWRQIIFARGYSLLPGVIYSVAWLEVMLLYYSTALPLPARLNPMGRTVGWSEIATHLDSLRHEQHADILIADGYKEASVFSFHFPGHDFVYALRHQPPANQFDFWPGYPTAAPHRALWITSADSPHELERDFNSITFLERVEVGLGDQPNLREYTIYRCENR